MLIEIDIRSYWRSGTGAGETGGIDASCAVDCDGLPYLPGKHLKGLLRDAVAQAIDFGWVSGVTVDDLFGQQGFRGLKAYSRAEKGRLRVDSAHLPVTDRDAVLASGDKVALIQQLFRNVQSTAMCKESGAAKDKSLRLEQVAVPLRLVFEVTELSGERSNWDEVLITAMPLIRAVGQKRTRGLGRAILRRAP